MTRATVAALLTGLAMAGSAHAAYASEQTRPAP
jgi:hypothetical protein